MKQEFSKPNNKKGFTLAETLITLTILGVVAAITIPALINRQQEAANRTKLKKAMSMYEKALNQMILENDIKGNVGTELNDETCSTTTEYFKKVERDNCRFKTADRVWWDITDIEHTVIMLNDKYKDTELAELRNLAKDKDNRDVFEMVGGIKDGIVRINDKSGIAEADKDYVDKLYAFVGGGIQKETDPYAKFSTTCTNPACSDDYYYRNFDSTCFACTSKNGAYGITIHNEEGFVVKRELDGRVSEYTYRNISEDGKWATVYDKTCSSDGNNCSYSIYDYDFTCVGCTPAGSYCENCNSDYTQCDNNWGGDEPCDRTL